MFFTSSTCVLKCHRTLKSVFWPIWWWWIRNNAKMLDSDLKGAKGTKTLKVQSHLAKLEPRMRTDADFANFYWLWKWLLCELCFMRRYTINKIQFLPNLADISLMWPHLNIHCLFLGMTASEPRRISILTVQFNLILKCHNWFRTSIWKHQGSPASDRNCLQDTLIEVKVFSRISKRQMFRGNMRSVHIIP